MLLHELLHGKRIRNFAILSTPPRKAFHPHLPHLSMHPYSVQVQWVISAYTIFKLKTGQKLVIKVTQWKPGDY